MDQLSVPDRVAHRRESADVLGRIPAQHHEIRDVTWSDSPKPARVSKPLRWSGGERGQDLAARHSRLGHQFVLFAGIVVVHAAHVGAKQDHASRRNPRSQLSDTGPGPRFAQRGAVMAQLVLEDLQGRNDDHFRSPHCGQERLVPRGRVRRGVRDHIHAALNGREQTVATARMDEHELVPAMGLLHGGSDRAVRKRGKRRRWSGSEHLQAIGPALEDLLRGGERSSGILHLRRRKLHVPEGSQNRRWWQPTLAEQTLPRRTDPRTWKLARLDPITDPPRVLPGRPGIEHAGETVSREHGLKLTGQLGRRQIRGIPPFPLEEVNVTVPEPGDDSESGAIERRNALGNSDRCPRADRGDLAVADNHDAVLHRTFRWAGVDRAARQEESQCKFSVRHDGPIVPLMYQGEPMPPHEVSAHGPWSAAEIRTRSNLAHLAKGQRWRSSFTMVAPAEKRHSHTHGAGRRALPDVTSRRWARGISASLR